MHAFINRVFPYRKTTRSAGTVAATGKRPIRGFSAAFAAVLCCLLTPALAQDRERNWMAEYVKLRLQEKNLGSLPIGVKPTEVDRILSPRIVGGTIAGPGDNPFQVALLDRNIANNFQAQFCGGSLIAPTFIVTAAHCSDFVTAGQVQVLTDTRRLDGTGVRRDVRRIVLHPGWNRSTFDNDVAVWELTAPVAGIPFATLATDDGPVGANLLATGWGALTEGGGRPIDLQRVLLPLVDRNNCNDANSYNGRITNNMLCAGRDAGGIDTCQGDSGGPLTGGAGNGVLIGITSWGTGCARPNLFGVYTRVSSPAIRDFILNNSVPPPPAPVITSFTCPTFLNQERTTFSCIANYTAPSNVPRTVQWTGGFLYTDSFDDGSTTWYTVDCENFDRLRVTLRISNAGGTATRSATVYCGTM